MRMSKLCRNLFACALLSAGVLMSSPVAAQTPPSQLKPFVVCGGTQPPPAKEPPTGSKPVILAIVPCFEKQGGTSVIEPETYLFYIQTRGSQPSQDRWVPYDAAAEERALEDFRRLWGTNFLTDLSVVAEDYVFPNGVVGKLIVYNMEERERIKIVNYSGSKQFEQTKLEEKMRDQGVAIRLDSFVDDGQIRRVKTMIRELLAEKGYQDVSIEHQIKPVEGGPKLVNLTFVINEGPKIRIERVDFVGNKAFEDGTLKKKMKENKERGFLSFITGGGTYQEAKFEEDAEKVQAHYRNNGYIYAQVGQPELKTLSQSTDGKTRRIRVANPC